VAQVVTREHHRLPRVFRFKFVFRVVPLHAQEDAAGLVAGAGGVDIGVVDCGLSPSEEDGVADGGGVVGVNFRGHGDVPLEFDFFGLGEGEEGEEEEEEG